MRRIFMMALYRALLTAASPVLLLYLAVRSYRDRRYGRSLAERFGSLPSTVHQTGDGSIWLHAVSVGEVLTSVRLLQSLRAQLPGVRLYVSVSTIAGRDLAAQKLCHLADAVFYAPLDFTYAVRRVLRRMRPRVLIVQETEIWPNLWNEAKRAGVGLMVVNGRISDKAFPKYRAVRWFFRTVLALPDCISAQSRISLDRFRALGAPAARSGVGGNLKYDFDPSSSAPPPALSEVIGRSAPSAIWIAASTMPPASPDDPEEDDAVIAAFQTLAKSHPRLLLILVPRKPERFDEAATRLLRAGIPFLRRSELKGGMSAPLPSVPLPGVSLPGAPLPGAPLPDAHLPGGSLHDGSLHDGSLPGVPLPGALLLDSIGELGSLFPLATVVFMGGTLVSRGGHNILEPAFAAKPVVAGPHMENFSEIAGEFRAADAMITIQSPAELAPAIERLLADPVAARALGERARLLAESKRGATAQAAAAAVELFHQSVPRTLHPALARILLTPFAALWSAGVRWRRARQQANAEALPKPVVSVGGIGMGGVGKTPLTIWLAGELKSAGVAPAFLTRGYRRQSLERVIVLPPGAPAPTSRTGDEAQLLLRSGLGPVGISGDRLAAGKKLLEQFQPDVFLLDDGFQHWRLRRDCDIVLIDALDPLSGGAAFPLGRQREPIIALERAHAVIVTRGIHPWPGLLQTLRRFTDAPVFYSRFVPLAWRRLGQPETVIPAADFAPGPSLAFCGLGNPASFWSTLGDLRIKPVRRWAFDDHHRYRPSEVRRLVVQAATQGAEVLLTTEKDVQNLPAGAHTLAAPLPIWWLEIGVELDRPQALLALVRERIGAPAPPPGPIGD
ncbi:MAG: tetraacyldisaccharide 4'-kinase [Acidobacteriota bacterium]